MKKTVSLGNNEEVDENALTPKKDTVFDNVNPFLVSS